MPKFFGTVGFAEQSETSPSVWEEVITEREYFGDTIKDLRRLESGASVNDDLSISNSFSIVADPYAYDNFHKMRYVNWMGSKWKVTSVEVSRPRLILSIGGIYNG